MLLLTEIPLSDGVEKIIHFFIKYRSIKLTFTQVSLPYFLNVMFNKANKKMVLIVFIAINAC